MPVPENALSVPAAFLQVSIAVKFRAWGIDLGHFNHTENVPLPPVLSLIEAIAGPVKLYEYNHNGVDVKLALVAAAV